MEELNVFFLTSKSQKNRIEYFANLQRKDDFIGLDAIQGIKMSKIAKFDYKSVKYKSKQPPKTITANVAKRHYLMFKTS